VVADPIRIRARWASGQTEVHVLMPHPMETGMRRDPKGDLIAAHYITDVEIATSGRVVLAANLSLAVSQDPLLHFRFRGGAVGERITVTWLDNVGQRRLDEGVIA
jgi:sulfur-oxidizing protein SoxZ